MPGPRLFLIDTFGFLFRAYHARARGKAPPMRTNAGLATEVVFIFNNMLRKLLATHKPDYIAAIFESEGPTLREQEFAAYKANRPEAPPDFREQVPYVARLLEAMRVPVLQFPGYEADDVIGTLARRARESGVEVTIVSSDKDMLQLVGEGVTMLNPAKDDACYDAAAVKEFLGVTPRQVPDLLALKGDAVDNIPGAPGIGDKGAKELIERFGSVEAAIGNASQVQRKAYRESLEANQEQIRLSKRLATIETAVPIDFELGAVGRRDPDSGALAALYRELEFFSLLKETEPEAPAPYGGGELGSEAELDAWIASLPAGAGLALALPPAGEGAASMLEEARVAVSAKAGEEWLLPAGMLSALRPLLEDSGRRKIVHDAKSVLLELWKRGMDLRGPVDDVMLFEFLLDADPSSCAMETLARKHLNRPPGPGAAALCELNPLLSPRVDTQGLRELYETIDLPLSPVLARMERTGIRIEPAALRGLSARMEKEISALAESIYGIAGHPFNINSPQQLGKVLFEEMKLPVAGRTGKTKAYSTAADVLETLAATHAIARMVLDYRQLAKLKGTYVDALPALIRPGTGRLHTTFNQTGAATGRLSSSNPNLQNIPIRTEMGREIRAAFVPEAGWRLVVADYSQIELRLLAHMSGDPVLVEAFRNGEDIHTRTAAEVFGLMPGLVTPEMRRNAKAVNFGIIYGLSAFGLAAQLGIPRAEAERYISSYFQRYAGVKRFIDSTISEVRSIGSTRTLFGRQRPIPDINSGNPNARGFAERTAVNTPLQGTAADLIKLAMIRIDARLREESWQARMLLQVHDELLFEAPPKEAAALSEMVRREMEQVYRLEVPLLVDLGVGDNWRDAK